MASLDLNDIYAPIREDMSRLGAFLKQEFASREPFIWEVLQHIARFRGKQIRPALLFFVSRLLGSKISEDHVKVGAVIELIHTATLVHDDVLDDAELRRNVETVHRRWGERAAVLIGDYIYSRAFHMATEVPGMGGLLSDTTHTICEGELLQIANRYREIDEDTYLDIIRKKTAVLYAVSCEIGGILGGLDAEQCRRLHDFGLQLGMAFQIVDDCLDYTGVEFVAGKSLGTDLRQGKMTLPLIYLMRSLPEGEAAPLHEILRRPLTEEGEKRVHQLLHRQGVLAGAFARAEAFALAGKAHIPALLNGNPGAQALRESLESVADYMVRRQR